MNHAGRSRLRHGRAASRGCEPLERRVLLSLSPAGEEFRANTTTANAQNNAAVAADADGDFVAVWAGNGTGDTSGIFAQRYNAAGVAQGDEFRANTFTTGAQRNSVVSIDGDGDFVIAWESAAQDGSGYGIYAQRYDAAGLAQGIEFRANTTTANSQTLPSVAMGAAGDFVIAWASDGDVFAQRYDALGVPVGGESRANTFTTGGQTFPSVGVDASGDFVVAWQSDGQDGSGNGIYAQRFDAAGVARGGEIPVNTFTTGHQSFPSMAVDASGDFAVAWQSAGQDGSGNGVYAQRYNAAGAAQGLEFRVNTTTAGAQGGQSLSMDADGDFVVVWNHTDGNGYGVFAKSFNAAGAAQGGEFPVNTFTAADQSFAAVSMDHDGDAVVAWQSTDQDGSLNGIYAQRFDESSPDAAAPVIGGVFLNGRRVLPYATHRPTLSQLVVSFSEAMSDAGGSTGVNSVTNPANWLVTRNGAGISPPSITFGFNPVASRIEAVLSFSAALTDGNILLKARDNLRDAAGNRLDGDLDGAAGGAMSLPFSVASPTPAGDEFRVNTFTTSFQLRPDVAMDADGNFLVAWASDGQDGSGLGVYTQRYDAAGAPQGGEFRANRTTALDQSNPAVALRADSPFADTAIVWDGNGEDDNSGIIGRGLLSDFRVNTTTAGAQASPAIAMDPGGIAVAAWQSAGQDGSGYGVYAQRYNVAGGAPPGGEFRVNVATSGFQGSPAVAVDASGNFVVAWQSDGQDGSATGIYARRYNSAGVAQGGEFRVNTTTDGIQSRPAVAMDADGDFVVVWDGNGPGDGVGVFAQRYDAAGVAQGGEFRVNTTIDFTQASADVAMAANGNFVVAWDGEGQGADPRGVYARQYTATGVSLTGELQVNTVTAEDQIAPCVAADAAGDFVVAWASRNQDGSNFGVYAQRFGLRGTPTVAMLTDNPDPVTGGNSITLSAGGISVDQGSIDSVSFYRESNGDPGLQVGVEGDTPVGSTGTDVGGFFTINVSTAGLGDGTYTYCAQATDDAGLAGAPASTTSTVTGAGPVAPRVAAVFVDGANWTAGFRQFLQASGAGSPTLGFRVDGGAAQFDELPWSNVNRFHLVFTGNVNVDNADLSVRGVNAANYALNAGAFAYNAATFTASWTLAANVANDKVLLDLNADAGGVTAAGVALDGEWTNGVTAFPSGSGAAGGDFRFQLNFLPGDVNRNGGIVNSLDLQAVRIRQFLSPANPGTPPTTYAAFFDVDGSAFINAIDVQQVRIRQFSSLPDGTPLLAARAPEPMARTASAGLYGTSPVQGGADEVEDALR